jgi:hypothetical protein
MMNNELRGIKKSIVKIRHIRLAYQPPASSIFLLEQTSHQPAVLFSQHQQPTISQTNRPITFLYSLSNL